MRSFVHRLEVKFVFLATIVIILGATVINYIVYSYERDEHYEMAKSRAKLVSSLISNMIMNRLDGSLSFADKDVQITIIDLVERISSAQSNYIRYLTVLDNNLEPVVAHGDSVFRTMASPARIKSAFEKDTVITMLAVHQKERVIETYEPVGSGERNVGLLSLTISLGEEQAGLYKLVRSLITIAVIVSVIAILVAAIVAGLLAKPIKLLATEMELVESPYYETSLRKDRRDELGTLQERFLVMLDRLRRSEEEKEKARSALVQADKMASIGTLASGIAHEINNPLAGLKQSIHRIRTNPENVAQTKKYITLIHSALDHIENVVKGLLDFSRKRELSLKKIDINEVLKNAVRMLEYQIDQNSIDCVENLDKDLPAVMGDAYYLEQVFVNLILNAIDAMPNGGELMLRSYSADTRAVVEIEDTGTGIEKHHLDEVFDPFFTTKEEGKGTGLGLSISYSVVKEHGGEITIVSRAGVGTKVAVILPYI